MVLLLGRARGIPVIAVSDEATNTRVAAERSGVGLWMSDAWTAAGGL